MDPAGDVQRRPSPRRGGHARNLEMAKTLISTSLLKIVSNRRAENAKRRGKHTSKQDAEKFSVSEAECRVVKSYSRLSCRTLLVKQIFASILLAFAVGGWIAGMATPRPPPVCAAGRDCRQ